MSKPGIIYRMTTALFDESNSVQLVVDISDYDNLIPDDDEEAIYNVEGAESPFELTVIDNDESPFKVIKSTQATIRFLSNQTVTMSNFAFGTDQRFEVRAYFGSDTIYRGFVAMGDMSEAYMPLPNVVELTATDNLGILKDIPLVDFDGNNPVGHRKLIKFLAFALKKTGIERDIYAAYNIKRVGDVSDISIPNSDEEHFFHVTHVESKTFEDEVGTSISCYDAIERILGFSATLFQRNGDWWIVRRDEIEHATRGLYVTKFDTQGTFVSNLGEIDFEKEIAKGSDIFFSQEATLIRVDRPKKSIRLNYNFETPLEVPDNKDFQRGTLVDGSNPLEILYTLDDWDALWSNTSTDDPQSTGMYLVKKYNATNYQTENFLRSTLDASRFKFWMSGAIPVHQKDRFNLGVDYRLGTDVGGSGAVIDNHVQVRLYGDDGTFWTYKSRTSGTTDRGWYQCTSTFRTFQKYFSREYDLSADLTEWVGLYDGEAIDIPVDGYIRILLYNSALYGTTRDTEIANLTFEYIPYINGSYQKYDLQYHRTEQTGNYKSKIEDRVYISDSPKKLFKGALFDFDGSTYVQSGLFYDASKFPDGSYPDATYEKPFGELQLFDVWNQYRTSKRLFDFTIQGLGFPDYDELIGLISKLKPTDLSPHNTGKFFTMLHFNQNFRLAESTGLMREVFDITETKDYSNHEFKYA